MTIAASSLIAPNGPIALVMFPGPNVDRLAVEAIVTAHITKAYADARIDDDANSDATKDKMARLLAIHTVLIEDVYPRMLAEPNSVTVTEKGGSTYTDKQRADFLVWANRYLAEFEGLLPLDEVEAGSWGTSVSRRAS
jgi:hypothetical protein